MVQQNYFQTYIQQKIPQQNRVREPRGKTMLPDASVETEEREKEYKRR